MERSRLKNVIILILVLVNVFLAFSLATRQAERANTHSRTLAELTALCETDSIRLNAGLPDVLPPDGKILQRSVDMDTALAISVLGSDASLTDEGSGVSTCSTAVGQGFFRSDGGFSMTGHLVDEDVESFCRKFCRSNDYQTLSVNFSGGSGSASAVQYYEGYPVVNASVTFLMEDGILISISGTRLPGTSASSVDGGSMKAATALTRFLNARLENGAVVSEITDIYLCYELQSTTAAPMVLMPVWCIVTDTAQYYVNCSTGAVSHN